MKLRSLFGAVAGALLLAAAFVPRADATVIVYFNFEDGELGTPNWDPEADVTPANGGDNPGGGTQFSTLTLTNAAMTGPFGGNESSAGGILLNRTALDSDPAPPVPPSFRGQGLLLNDTKGNDAALCFTVDTTFLRDLSLSFATDNNGNGFKNVELKYSINGGNFVSVGTQALPTMGTAITTFNIDPTDSVFKGDGTPQTTTFCLIFTGGQSNGNDRQTLIDNIQLNGTIVPEPATVVGGLLGLCGLCWHQRRRLIRSVRLWHA
jgi:hypothetical protein